MSIPFLPPIEWDRKAWVRQVATTVNALIRQVSGGFSPGDLKPIAGPNIPTGWLLCDGSAQSRTEYPELYEAIGTIWGAGDGSTTFNLPPRGLILMGAGDHVSLGQTAGAATVTLTADNLPSHDHAITDPGHSHTFAGDAHTHTITDPGHSHEVTDPGHEHTVTDPGHTHSALAAASTSTVGAAAGDGTAGSTGSSVTGVTVDSAETGVTVDSNNTGVLVDSATAGGTNSEETTGITVGETGGGQAFTILPPVAGVQWIIKT